MAYKIEKGIPIPEIRKRNKWGELLASLEVGDSVYIKGKLARSQLGPSLALAEKKWRKKFVGRREALGMRLWRVK